METKYITIPFDLERAKRISSGEEEGKIVTGDGRNARIVCWDSKVEHNYPIIALVQDGEGEIIYSYRYDGNYNSAPSNEFAKLLLYVPEWTTFKDGDVYKTESGSVAIYNGNYKAIMNNTPYYVGLRECDNELIFQSNDFGFGNIAKCTLDVSEGEKQKLIDALKKSTEPKAKEYLKRFFCSEEKKEFDFNPFDKVLVRDDNNKKWIPGFFWSKGEEFYGIIGGTYWKQCVPYEGNEHLLGSSNDPE